MIQSLGALDREKQRTENKVSMDSKFVDKTELYCQGDFHMVKAGVFGAQVLVWI